MAYRLSNVLMDALAEESRRRDRRSRGLRVNVPTGTSLDGQGPLRDLVLTSGIGSVVTTIGDGSTRS